MFTKRTIRFQSTLPREERQILILFNRFECLFQSTLPREERPLPFNALTATTSKFQSTLPREERRIFDFIRIIFILFQSTLPREERRNAKTSYSIRDNFNPRSHERSDNQAFHALSCFFRFQSTLPREERQSGLSCAQLFFPISIHAPTRGAT